MLFHNIDTQFETWQISFTIKQYEVIKEPATVFVLLATRKLPTEKLNLPIPRFFVINEHLIFYFAVENTKAIRHFWKLTLNTEHRVIANQKRHCLACPYVVTINFDGKNIFNSINHHPRRFTDVKCIWGDLRYTAPVIISNFVYKSPIT